MNAITPVLEDWRPPASALEPMLRDVRGVIDRTVERARAAGRDLSTQWLAAAHAVVAVRPDLSLTDALQAVRRLRALDAI
jgi:hypothetical protein